MGTYLSTVNKNGYLWFVREEIEKPEGSQSPFDVNRYHIYFGDRKYGESWNGLYEAIEAMASVINSNTDSISKKQDKIDDLEAIRSGAALGATALQEVPAEYVTETELNAEIAKLIDSAPETLNTLGELAAALKDNNDVIVALNNVIANKADKDHTHSQYLTEHQDISGKQDVIEDLEAIRSGAALGKTALQSIPDEYITESELEGKNYATVSQVNAKQDTITDLETIRSGAALGATALQTLPEHNHDEKYQAKGNYAAAEHNHNDHYYTETEIDAKLLSKQDLIQDLSTIRSGAALGATALQSLPTHNHDDRYYTKTEMNTNLASKQDVITDLEAIRSGETVVTASDNDIDGIFK
jgi:hypothetical protein